MTQKIVFKTSVVESAVDAFTGGKLIGVISKCPKCQCQYGEDSVSILEKENGGNCMSCGELLPIEEKRIKLVLRDGADEIEIILLSSSIAKALEELKSKGWEVDSVVSSEVLSS
jgi:hypothetical protein